MKADGSIIIDTKILDGGMEKGFELIKDEMSSVGITAKQVGEQIQLSFSKMDVSKPIANAFAKVQQLEQQLASVTSDYQLAVSEEDDKSAERLAAKRIAIYDRMEAAREKLSVEISAAVQREADAEEKASQRAIKAAEKEAAAKQRAAEKQFRDMTKPARRFGTRFREIVSGALIFNVISAGLRKVVSYFDTALNANQEYVTSLAALRGSLMTAFQPVYESVVPAIVALVNWLNIAVQAIGRFFSTLSGKSYGQMQKNAQALNKQAGAIGGVGNAAEEAAKQLAGFDEINRLDSVKNASSGGGGGANSPLFEATQIPSEWETAIDSLAMRVKDIFFEWENLTPEIIAEKIVAGLGAVTGGLIGFAIGGPRGALIGMTIGAGLGVVLSNIIFNGDGNLTADEILAALVAGISIIGGAVIGFAAGGPGGALLGATIGLGLTFTILGTAFDDVEKNYDELADKIIEWSDLAARTTENGFIVPTHDQMLSLRDKIKDYFSEAKDSIVQNFDLAARTTENGFILPTQEEMLTLKQTIIESFSSAKDWVTDTWVSLPNWFETNVTRPIVGFFNSLSDGISSVWDDIVHKVISAVRDIVSAFSRFSFVGGETVANPVSYYTSPAIAAYSQTPEIPHLAKGAVLPPNKPFLAMVGDQTHGTNVEAPLETIKQAMAEVMAECGWDIQINFTGDLAQLARILYPEIHRQDRNTAKVGGW